MDCFFWTAANAKYRGEAQILIRSGRRFGIDIHCLPIPEQSPPWRYKSRQWLDLPDAERYVYFDSDCILARPADWQAEDCLGASRMWWQQSRPAEIAWTRRTVQDHLRGDGAGRSAILALHEARGSPAWANSGVMVLTARQRREFIPLWLEWIARTDELILPQNRWGDEVGLMFAKSDYGLPDLPGQYNWLLKWQHGVEQAVVIHADGHVSGTKRVPYERAIEDLERWETEQASGPPSPGTESSAGK
jgi:hypothetical protein